jgi:hypothetical protein
MTKKRSDFLLFKQALDMFKNKDHLTKEGLIKMVNIKASINKGLSNTLKEAFPDVKKIEPSSCFAPKGLIYPKVDGKSINPY